MSIGKEQKSVTRKGTNHPSALKFANEDRELGVFVDKTIVVGTTKINVHSLILASSSEFFRTMFTSEMKKRYEQNIIIRADLDPDAVKILVDFVYTETIIINNENILQLLHAADYLQMTEPKQFCVEFLESIISIDNCLSILGVALLYKIENLQNLAHQTMNPHFKTVAESNEFKALGKDDVTKCIVRLDRSCLQEVWIYEAIISWVKYDQRARKLEFVDLFELIKLDRLPMQFLKDTVATEELVEADYSCLKLIKNALRKSIYKKSRKILSIGGSLTANQVIEVFREDGKLTQIYPSLAFDMARGIALKLDDYIYCIGAWNSDTGLRRIKLIDDEQQIFNFETAASMNKERSFFSATIFDGKIVVTGGKRHRAGNEMSSSECYYPEVNEWRELPRTNEKKRNNALVVCNGCLYDIGGGTGLSSVERLRSLESQWEYVASINTERHRHAAVSCKGLIYVMGGSSKTIKSMKSMSRYDPTTDEWSDCKDMSFGRRGHAACVMKNQIYVVGGINAEKEYIKEIERYDPDADMWTSITRINEELENHTLIVI